MWQSDKYNNGQYQIAQFIVENLARDLGGLGLNPCLVHHYLFHPVMNIFPVHFNIHFFLVMFNYVTKGNKFLFFLHCLVKSNDVALSGPMMYWSYNCDMPKCLIKMMWKLCLVPCLCVPVTLIYQTLFEDFVNITLHSKWNKPECTCMHNNAR